MRSLLLRRALILVVPLALLAGGSAFVRTPSKTSCKPTAPIDLEAALVGDPSGGPFGVSAKATSRTGHDVDLEVVLPDSVTHLAGERKMRGRRCDLRVDLRAWDRKRSEILVRATIIEGTARLTRVVPLVIFDEAPAASKGREKVNSQGERIVEYSP